MTLPIDTPEQLAQRATLADNRDRMRLANLERANAHNATKHARHMIERPTTRDDLAYRVMMLHTQSPKGPR